MQGPAHLVLSWFAAEAAGLDAARDRRIVGLAGLSPDADALVYPVALVWYGFDRGSAFEKVWLPVHHHYTHSIGFALVAAAVAYAVGRGPDRAKVAALSALMVLLHVFFDLVAAGATFPVYPWSPFHDAAWMLSWSWELRDWPNQVITFGALAATLVYARVAGLSPVECLSYRADAWLVRVVREGSDRAGPDPGEAPRVLGLRREVFIRVAVFGVLAVASAALVIPVADELF